MATNNQTGPAAPEPEESKGAPNSAAIDIEQLAERIYQLMRAEVRLERARGMTAGTFRSE
jgi:hypothetical protein